MSDEAKKAFEELTPSQRQRGQALAESISVEKLTSSFSIEERSSDGRKKASFYSVSASRGGGSLQGYTLLETEMVRAILGRHVVRATYDDAFRRGVIVPSPDNLKERDQAVAAYDIKLAKLLSSENPEPAT